MFPAARLREGPGGGEAAALTARRVGGPAPSPSRPPGGLPAGCAQVPRRAIPAPPAGPSPPTGAASGLPAPRPIDRPGAERRGREGLPPSGPHSSGGGRGEPGSFKRGARAPRAGRRPRACPAPPRPARAPRPRGQSPLEGGASDPRSPSGGRWAGSRGGGVGGSPSRPGGAGTAAAAGDRRPGRAAPTPRPPGTSVQGQSGPAQPRSPPAGAQGPDAGPPWSAGWVGLSRGNALQRGLTASSVARHRTKHLRLSVNPPTRRGRCRRGWGTGGPEGLCPEPRGEGGRKGGLGTRTPVPRPALRATEPGSWVA